MAEVLSPIALCTDADVAAYLPDGDGINGDLVIRLVNAASEQITNLAGREFVSADLTTHGGTVPSADRDFMGSEVLYIPRDHPLWLPCRDRELELGDAQDVTAVKITTAGGAVTNLNITTDVRKLPLRRRYSWEPIAALGFKSSPAIAADSVITVTAKWGFARVPEAIRQEAIRAAGSWYMRDVRRQGSIFASEEATAPPAPELAHVLPRSAFETALAFRRFHA